MTSDRSTPSKAWTLSAPMFIALLIVLGATEIIARAFTDPEFFLPDPFRWLSIGLIATFALTMPLPWARLRAVLRVVALVFVVAVLLLELRSGVFSDTSSRVVQVDDPILRYHYAPGFDSDGVVVTPDGLLDVQREMPKPADVLRVVVLTGSIANDNAIPFEERFFRQMERQLQTAVPGKRVEVVNVSCEGFSTLQQVRFLEQVGLAYEPDVVVVAFMLTAASFQNGGRGRIGNSHFAFRFIPLIALARGEGFCSAFAPFFETYTYGIIVQNSFERLALLQQIHGFQTLVAVLPIVERFDHPHCTAIYDQVVNTAQAAGLPAIRVADAFAGMEAIEIQKPEQKHDLAHPNPLGHRIIGDAIADAVRPLLTRPTPTP